MPEEACCAGLDFEYNDQAVGCTFHCAHSLWQSGIHRMPAPQVFECLQQESKSDCLYGERLEDMLFKGTILLLSIDMRYTI